jgi:hypothetical protein
MVWLEGWKFSPSFPDTNFSVREAIWQFFKNFFSPSLMLWRNTLKCLSLAWILSQGKCLRLRLTTSVWSTLLSQTKNIRPGKKCLPEKNGLAYSVAASMTVKKSFMTAVSDCSTGSGSGSSGTGSNLIEWNHRCLAALLTPIKIFGS